MWQTVGRKLFRTLSARPVRQVHQQCIAGQLLKDRAVIKVSGPDAGPFLQGLMTNDIRHLEEETNVMYCLFLNIQGRILYDSLIYNGLEPGTYLIECDVGGVTQLAKHLSMYRVRRKVGIGVDETLRTWVLFQPPPKELEGNFVLAKDPRVKELGWRLLVNTETDLSRHVENLEPTTSYRELRYRLGVGEGIGDLPPGTSFPLECNGDYLHGISFHKGCYIGQELTARTYHTGVTRKRLMPVKFHQSPPPDSLKPDSTVTNEANARMGKLRGFIPGSQYALGLLRVQEALSSTALLKVDSNPVCTHRPDWWPLEAPKHIQSQN